MYEPDAAVDEPSSAVPAEPPWHAAQAAHSGLFPSAGLVHMPAPAAWQIASHGLADEPSSATVGEAVVAELS